jgi:hypothetical protein
VPITIGADDDSADRAHDEADAIGGKSREQRDDRIAGGKEVSAELDREQAEDHEVERFDEVADHAGQDGSPP